MGKVSAEPSVGIQKRVAAARNIQSRSFKRTRIFYNVQMGSRHIRAHCAVNPDSRWCLLETAVDRLWLSARAYNRILKIARTLTDLIVGTIQYRTLDRGKSTV